MQDATPYLPAIGRNPGHVGASFSGLLDNVFIFDEALSDTQINEIRQNGQRGIESVAAVPSPNMLMLFSIGLLALFRYKRQKNNNRLSQLP